MPFDPTQTLGTPPDAPLTPRLPIRLRRTEILTVVYETDRDAADALIPSPLELTAPICVANVYWMHDAEWFGVYGESALQLPVRLPDGSSATYSPYLVLGSDAAIAAGRELYGQSKKAGAVTLGADGDLLVGRVERNGIDILTATMCFKQSPAEPAALDELVPGAAVNVNLRVLPDGEGGYRRELLAREFADVIVHEAWTGPATLELRANAQMPVHKLPVRSVVLGLHRVLDLSLPPARLVHRY